MPGRQRSAPRAAANPMLIGKYRQKLRADLESPAPQRRWGTGWLSGVAALVVAVAGLLLVLCQQFPDLLAVPPIRPYYHTAGFHVGLLVLLIAAFVFAVLSLLLRSNRVLGLSAVTVTLVAGIIGGMHAPPHGGNSGVFFGLDWFVLNVIFTGFLFIPLERLFPRIEGQSLFRTEWREDLFYYLVSSMLVQVLTFLSMAPALALTAHTHFTSLRAAVAGQPVVLQIVEIMFCADIVQYWVHRAFHRVPFLWGFHAVHHSARSLDWMAGARMHFAEIVVLRGSTVIPLYLFGFGAPALHAYILLVYIHSSLVHANVGWNLDHIGRFLVTPRFHHWHHGIDPEAIDVNFAIHFPLLDRLFGTYHFPARQWPSGYGVGGHPVPNGYWRQLWYPLRHARSEAAGSPDSP